MKFTVTLDFLPEPTCEQSRVLRNPICAIEYGYVIAPISLCHKSGVTEVAYSVFGRADSDFAHKGF